jgi:transposase
VTRLRSSFWKLRHQVGARIKSLLFTQGLIQGDDNSRITKKWLTEKLLEIDKKQLPGDIYYAVNQYAEEWLHLTDVLKRIEERLKTQAKQESVLHTIYTSVPGIGLIHGRQLANELGNMSQFQNEKQLFSYAGLTPSEYSSGEHVRQGHISRQGRSVLRKIMVEASWKAIEKDPNLCEVFERIALHKGKKRAIVAVARRLLGRIRSCLLSGTLYEITPRKKEENDQITRTINKHSALQEIALV